LVFISLAGATHMAAFGTIEAGLQLPRHGTFTVAMRLQANVSPGPYSIETAVWSEHHAIYSGPRLALEVTATRVFDGTVQLNPSMTLSTVREAHDGSAMASAVLIHHVN
jgi:hypothetical protein